MAKLSAWLKKRLGSKSAPPEKQSADRPPYLPSPRRPLTLAVPNSRVTQPSECDFFAKLPSEVRRKILMEAFGARILHMDLEFHVTPSPPPSKAGSGLWQWAGSICEQHGMVVPLNGWQRSALPGLSVDTCVDRMHGRNMPYDQRVQWTEKYAIGIMGFLQTCRQAYAEGIDVLFTSNTLSIQSEPLLLHLPRLIPLEHLASISSLQLCLTAHAIRQDDGRASFNLDHLKPILDNVARNCHHLRSFEIMLRGFHSLRDQIGDGPTMPLLDNFYRTMQLPHMRVVLPHVTYFAFSSRSMDPHPLEAVLSGLHYETSRWRCLDGEEPVAQTRSTENYPGAPYKLPVSENGLESALSLGYWMSVGESWHPHVSAHV